jgi:hypothetical protein
VPLTKSRREISADKIEFCFFFFIASLLIIDNKTR